MNKGNSRTSERLLNKEIGAFCDKWIAIINNPDSKAFDFIENLEFSDECRKLGFVMDCGNSFVEKYGQTVFNDPGALSATIELIDDTIILGSAIFSQWRYYSHWAMDSFQGSKIETWVIIAFNRLKILSSNNLEGIGEIDG